MTLPSLMVKTGNMRLAEGRNGLVFLRKPGNTQDCWFTDDDNNDNDNGDDNDNEKNFSLF